MKSEIILISAIGAGKTTVGKLLAERLNLPQCSMDELRWDYYAEIGYNQELARQKREKEGVLSLTRYWKPFEAHAVTRLLAEHQECVIDFGAGHSVYEDPELFKKVQQALAPYKNVVLLLPSPDLDESLQILSQREGDLSDEELSLNEHFLRHSSNYELAKLTIYTKDKTPEATCSEILAAIGLPSG
ncbi:shikimate kinase [Merismopedia glauca]|uniref:Shikimate kinase n=1 Tax=Merismopedia glauca CCAP 1448/3 TaxID=1296344 RepID=A0A2T1C013_9CYAN|nr:shikimate kinase [Merismopedia glauca]PSB01616.1 shikimate kinase [Merismopedia glauca CCAP 1448/3]